MKDSVYVVRALYDEFDDFPCDVESIHKTREGAEAARLAAIADSRENIEDSTRDYEIVRFELGE